MLYHVSHLITCSGNFETTDSKHHTASYFRHSMLVFRPISLDTQNGFILYGWSSITQRETVPFHSNHWRELNVVELCRAITQFPHIPTCPVNLPNCITHGVLTDSSHQRAGGNLRYFETRLSKQLKELNQEVQEPATEEPIQLGTYKRPKDYLPEREIYEGLCRGEGVKMVRPTDSCNAQTVFLKVRSMRCSLFPVCDIMSTPCHSLSWCDEEWHGVEKRAEADGELNEMVSKGWCLKEAVIVRELLERWGNLTGFWRGAVSSGLTSHILDPSPPHPDQCEAQPAVLPLPWREQEPSPAAPAHEGGGWVGQPTHRPLPQRPFRLRNWED